MAEWDGNKPLRWASVRREHREAALDALIGPSKWPGMPLACHYAATGGDSFDGKTLLVAPKPVALAIAQAEYSVRAHVLDCLKAIADTADIVDQGSPVLYVRVDSIESLIIELEAQL